MIQKIKRYLLVISSVLMIGVPALVPTMSAYAGCTGISKGIAEGVNSSIDNGAPDVNCNENGVNDDGIKKLAARIVNTFSIIVGAVSVIMIIYGGFRYITSGGESGRVGAAKNSLIYAILGLVIVALAQLIIRFVLNQTTQLQ